MENIIVAIISGFLALFSSIIVAIIKLLFLQELPAYILSFGVGVNIMDNNHRKLILSEEAQNKLESRPISPPTTSRIGDLVVW